MVEGSDSFDDRMASQRLKETLESIDVQIMQIAQRPLMYVGGEEHLHAAEVMVRILLHIRDCAMGNEGVSRDDQRHYMYERYPKVPGPIRCVATGSKEVGLDFSQELLRYIAWHKEHATTGNKGS